MRSMKIPEEHTRAEAAELLDAVTVEERFRERFEAEWEATAATLEVRCRQHSRQPPSPLHLMRSAYAHASNTS